MAKGDVAVSGTRACFRRLGVPLPPPTTRGALNAPGGDPRAKRRTAMQLVDGHAGSAAARARFAQLVGTPPGTGFPPGSDNPGPATRATAVQALDPESGVQQWLQARNAIITQGRADGLDKHDRPVQRLLAPVDAQFQAAAAQRKTAIREALAQRSADLPDVPALGTELPPPDRAEQLRLVRERVSGDLDQYVEHCRLAIGSSDRALAGELVSVGRTNTATTAAPWGDGPAYMVVRGTEAQPGLLDQVEEHFETPKTAAGAVNALLTELQLKQLEGLETALASPAPEERIPGEFNAHVYWAFEVPDPSADPADRYERLMALARPSEQQPKRLQGQRLVDIQGEKQGPARSVRDVGYVQL